MHFPRLFICCLLFLVHPFCTSAQQGLTRFDQFEINEQDVVWKATYTDHKLKGDSLRFALVALLKSKFYTFNVVRTLAGYNGELNHLKVDCKKYGRTYLNTPRLYWDGEWSGKFTVSLTDSSYHITIYALYYEKPEPSSGYYRTEKNTRGRYIDAVTIKSKAAFRKNELNNLSLFSQFLKDEFELKARR